MIARRPVHSCPHTRNRLLEAVERLAADQRMQVLPARVPMKDHARAAQELWERGWVLLTDAGEGRLDSETLPHRFFQGTGVSLTCDAQIRYLPMKPSFAAM